MTERVRNIAGHDFRVEVLADLHAVGIKHEKIGDMVVPERDVLWLIKVLTDAHLELQKFHVDQHTGGQPSDLA
jgi:RNA-binding protein YlmH